MARKNKSEKLPKNDSYIEFEGVVTSALPELIYITEIEFKGLKHQVKCHVSGKMRTNFIQLEKGDKVRLKISLYDIDKGIITRRLTSRHAPQVVETPTV